MDSNLDVTTFRYKLLITIFDAIHDYLKDDIIITKEKTCLG